MAEFIYNNTKNASIGHTYFQLNCGYQPRISIEEDVDCRLKSLFANKLAKELKKLIEVYYRNLLYIQELQKKAHDQNVKSRSYAPSKKI